MTDYYGPWIEPPEHEDLIMIDEAPQVEEGLDKDAIIEYIPAEGVTGSFGGTERPNLSSGITLSWRTHGATHFTVSADVGRTGDVTASELLWKEVYGSADELGLPLQGIQPDPHIPRSFGSPATSNYGGYVHHHGTLDPSLLDPDYFGQTDQWTVAALHWEVSQKASSPIYSPPAVEWPAGAIGVEVETEEDGTYPVAALTGLTIECPFINPDVQDRWGLFINPAPSGRDWFGQGTNWTAREIREGAQRIYPDANGVGGHDFTADELAALQTLMAPASAPDPGTTPFWPEVAALYIGQFPSDPPFAIAYWGPWEVTYQWSLRLHVRIRFRTPRYRFVYATSPFPSPRRVFPRDDGLTGGACRTWPDPRSSQGGRRTFGDFL